MSKVQDFYDEVSRIADTESTQINAAEVRRVLACGFSVLQSKTPAEAAEIVSEGLNAAAAKQAG